MNSEKQPAYLIVNADDYGYFNCVSRGILESTQNGIVTATGIFANSAFFDEHVSWLADYDTLDLGVHLNLTAQEPLSIKLRKELSRWAGRFPGKFSAAKAVLFGAIPTEAVELEWRAQIERCLEKGLKIRFLNSHEHMHMLPPLFSVVQKLAEDYEISHIRFSTASPFKRWTLEALVRDLLISQLAMINRRRLVYPVPEFLGLDTTGKLNIDYLMRIIPLLKPGKVYELMCHPGRLNQQEVYDSRLMDYHDWEGELVTLTDAIMPSVLSENRVRLVGYRHLEIQSDQFIVHRDDTEVS